MSLLTGPWARVHHFLYQQFQKEGLKVMESEEFNERLASYPGPRTPRKATKEYMRGLCVALRSGVIWLYYGTDCGALLDTIIDGFICTTAREKINHLNLNNLLNSVPEEKSTLF